MPEKIIQFAGNDARLPPPTQQLFGVEIEVENVAPAFRNQTIELGETWSTKLDGSLRNNGLEFITLPRTLDQMKIALRRFYRWHEEFHFSTSIRTSMHVHADMRLYDVEQLRSLVTAVCLVEPLLMRACSGVREENIYCVPFYRVNGDLESIRSILDTPNRRFTGLGRTCKYSALYLEPLLRFGTVEFRQAPVWNTVGAAVEWVECINDLITYSVNVNPNTVLDRFAEEGAEAFCTTIFGAERKQSLKTVAGLTNQDLHDVFEAHDVVRQATMLLTEKCGRKLSEWAPPNLKRGPHAVVAEPLVVGRRLAPRNPIDWAYAQEAGQAVPAQEVNEDGDYIEPPDDAYEQEIQRQIQTLNRLRQPTVQPVRATVNTTATYTTTNRAGLTGPMYTWTVEDGHARMVAVPQAPFPPPPGTPATRNAGPAPNAAARRAVRRRNQQPRRRT